MKSAKIDACGAKKINDALTEGYQLLRVLTSFLQVVAPVVETSPSVVGLVQAAVADVIHAVAEVVQWIKWL